jgi:hypothetical protein
LIKEWVEVLNHADFGEYSMYDVFPPLFLILDSHRAGATKVADECSLDASGGRLIRIGCAAAA